MSVNKVLSCAILFFLPFTYALTLNVGWPLKIYELILLLVIGINIFRIHKIKLSTVSRKILISFLVFIVWIFVSMFFNFFSLELDAGSIDSSVSRFSSKVDVIIRLTYIIFVFLGALIVYSSLKDDRRLAEKYWLWGATVSAIYAIALFLFSFFFDPHYFLLPGIERPQTILFLERVVIRSGTFLEGNFAGLYYILSLLLAIKNRSSARIILFIVAIISTFSAVSIALGTFVLFYYVKDRFFAQRKMLLPLVTVMLVFALAYSLGQSFFNQYIFDKFVFVEEDLHGRVSLVDRVDTIHKGWILFKENPIFGVGIGKFGDHYSRVDSIFSDLLSRFENSRRRIVNNIYVELLCELGLVGLFLFLMIMGRFYIESDATEYLNFRNVSLLIMMLYFLAFPTYTLFFIWAFLAMLCCTDKKEAGELAA